MSAVVIPLRPRKNTMLVQPAKGGFTVVLVTPDGHHHHRGTRERLIDARMFASDEAFRVGRCRVQILGTEGRS